MQWVTRTIEQRGLVLPWQRVERYGPFLMYDGKTMSDNPPKGTVLESGEVFVSEDALWEMAERTIDDYITERTPPSIGFHERLALEQAGLADGETRGGCHGTEKLRTFLETSADD